MEKASRQRHECSTKAARRTAVLLSPPYRVLSPPSPAPAAAVPVHRTCAHHQLFLPAQTYPYPPPCDRFAPSSLPLPVPPLLVSVPSSHSLSFPHPHPYPLLLRFSSPVSTPCPFPYTTLHPHSYVSPSSPHPTCSTICPRTASPLHRSHSQTYRPSPSYPSSQFDAHIS